MQRSAHQQVISRHQLVYLDQNPFDDLMKAGVTAEALSGALTSRSFELILSADNFQEWASCWKSRLKEKQHIGQTLLRFILAAQPRRFLAPAHQLMTREIRMLFGQHLRGPFLPQEDITKAEGLLHRFANGGATEVDRETMLSHWDVKREATAKAERHRKEGVAGINLSGETLDAFIAANPDLHEQVLRNYVEKATGQPPTGRELKLIRRRLVRCPALTAAVRIYLFTTWWVAAGKAMRHDRWDDLRHGINAAYANLFVTGDAWLRSAFAEIKAGHPVVGVSEFAEVLGLPYPGAHV